MNFAKFGEIANTVNSLDVWPSLNRLLRVFSFSMRELNVEEGNPSLAAVPLGPDKFMTACLSS